MSMMQRVFLFIVIIFSFLLKSQTSSVCSCALLRKHEDSIQKTYKGMESLIEETKSKRKSLKRSFDFVRMKNVKNPSLAIDIVDSLDLKYQKAILNKVPDSLFGFSKIKDSLIKNAFKQKYYGIPKPLILKIGKIDKTIGILFFLNSSFKSKYYLSLSNDEGKTWKNYFTGLYQNDHYVFKSNSKFPLWKDTNNIQIESDIVRMIEPLTFPGGGPSYETVKNDALVVLNLKEILKDSDDDGWNDLDEKMNYFTNPFSSDTDGDGIIDSEDINPKYATANNDFTKIFEAIVYGNFPLLESANLREESFEINIKTFNEDIKKQQEKLSINYPKTESDSLDYLQAKVIVTDDEYLQRINTFGEKIIFLTSKEYKEYQKINPFNMYCQSYTKIFKCDTIEDTYVVKFDGVVFGNTYLIKKTSNGYLITILENWIT